MAATTAFNEEMTPLNCSNTQSQGAVFTCPLLPKWEAAIGPECVKTLDPVSIFKAESDCPAS